MKHSLLALFFASLFAGCASNQIMTAQTENKNSSSDEYRTPASSDWLMCTPHKNAKDNGYGEMQIQVTATELKYKGQTDSHKAAHGTAKRDHEFKDEDQYRYVGSSTDLFSSDADVAFFADKDLAKGKKGTLGVSNQIICDGDACHSTLEWGSQGNWTCE